MDALQLNDTLHELHEPQGDPGMQILFFHGLQAGEDENEHLTTWKSGDGKCLWPKTWLVEKYKNAHILTVSYNAGVLRRNSRGNLEEAFRIYVIVENLISDLMQKNIGQRPDCPVILVGHSFGGLVIKQLCVQAFVTLHLHKKSEREKKKLETFLGNVKGIFNYSTPHHGSPAIDELADSSEHPLLKYFKTLSTETEYLNFQFSKLRSSYTIRTHGLGESLPAETGLFKGLVWVPEPSARDGDTFHVVKADHTQICRPNAKNDRRFYGLTNLIDDIAHDLKDSGIHQETIVQQEERPREKATICEGTRVGEKTWPMEEAQPLNFLHQPRHVAVQDHVQFWRPMQISVDRTPEEKRLQQEMWALTCAQSQNPRHVMVADRGHIHMPMQETSRGLRAPREQLGKTAIDSTTVRVQRPANPQQTQDDARHISTRPSGVVPGILQINDSIFEVHNPIGRPSIEIVFFHSLQHGVSKEVFLTWLSADGSEFWPTWILKDFPDARILLVSYNTFALRKDEQGRMDMYLTCENLVEDLTNGGARAGVGEDGCPVILVGAFDRRSSVTDITSNGLEEPWFKKFTSLSRGTQRMDGQFRALRSKYGWKTFGIGEGLPTILGQFSYYLVEEASARHDMDEFYTCHDADHFNVCRPMSTTSSAFVLLSDFIGSVLQEDLAKSRAVLDADRYSRL